MWWKGKATLVLITAVLGLVAVALILQRWKPGAKNPPENLDIASASSVRPAVQQVALADDDITSSRENAITRAVKKVSPAVVGINVIQVREYVQRSPFSDDPFFRQFFPDLRYQEKVKSLGSGFLISPEGVIVTNEHVVSNATQIVVTLPDGSRHDGRIIGSDYVTDIAVLKIDGRHFPSVTLGNSDDVIVGEWVIAFGNPFGLFDVGSKPTVSVGVVSQVDMDFGRQSDNRVYQDMIQTDASINSGNSGGPLVNSLGEVIGVNTFIMTPNQWSGSVGVGFATPINRVRKVIEELKTHGEVNRRFWSGLEVENVTPLMARFLGLRSPEGVIISHVAPGSPAEEAKLQVGDMIVSVNGKRVRDVQDIWTIIEDADMKGGDRLQLKVYRKNRLLEVTLRLESLPG